MADQLRGRTRRDDDMLVPLITGLVVLAAAGPALFTAATQWLLPRLTAGTETVTVTLAGWWDRNGWLVILWSVELVALLVFLGWSRRRRQGRERQLESVTAGLARVLPDDWDPRRHLRVRRWQGHRPAHVRVELSARSPLHDEAWRRSVADGAARVLGPLRPIAWPDPPPRTGVFDWARRAPAIELRLQDSKMLANVDDRRDDTAFVPTAPGDIGPRDRRTGREQPDRED